MLAVPRSGCLAISKKGIAISNKQTVIVLPRSGVPCCSTIVAIDRGKAASASGPAWSAELAQEDVLSSLEFANNRFFSATAVDVGDGFDDGFDDGLEVETIM